MKPWIRETGQLWKALVFGALLGIAALFLVAMVFAINGAPLHSALDELGALALFLPTTLTAFAWLFLSIRCGACGGKPAWHMVRTAPVQSWFVLLVSSVGCLACGRIPSGPVSANVSEARVTKSHNYCMQRTAGRLAGVTSVAALAGRR